MTGQDGAGLRESLFPLMVMLLLLTDSCSLVGRRRRNTTIGERVNCLPSAAHLRIELMDATTIPTDWR